MVTKIQPSFVSRAQDFAEKHPYITAAVAATTLVGTALTVVGLNASTHAWKVASNMQQTGHANKGFSVHVRAPFINKMSFAANAGLSAVKEAVTSATSPIHKAGSYAFTATKESVSNGLSSVQSAASKAFASIKGFFANASTPSCLKGSCAMTPPGFFLQFSATKCPNIKFFG